MHPFDHESDGTAWRVSIPLTSSLDLDIVTPKAFFQGAENIGGQRSPITNDGIIIMGFTYSMTTSGASSLSLIAHDDPWISEGTLVDDTIWTDAPSAAGRHTHYAQCRVPLSPTGIRPDASPTSATGATLKLTTGTNVSGGSILVWGIHSSHAVARQAQTGSPVVY